VTRKLVLFPLALVLFFAACAPPGTPNLAIQANQNWFTSTVDGFLDAGRSASMSLDKDGLPFLTYLSLNQKLPAGQIPAVMTANLTAGGVWDHGAVISTQDAAHPLKLTTSDQAASTIDPKGNEDAAFTLQGELQYSTASAGGAFSSTPEKVTPISHPIGMSIAATSDGTPFIAWLDGTQVMVATKTGKKWATHQMATLSAAAKDPQRTALVSDGSTVWLAYSDPSGQGPMFTQVNPSGAAGKTSPAQAIEAGAGGDGISLDSVKGALYASYYTNDGQVRVAKTSSPGTGGWTATSVAQTSSGPSSGWAASVGVTDKGTQYVAWYDAKQNDLHLATSTGGSFKELSTTGTNDAERPVLAVTPDGSDVFVAYYDNVNRDMAVGNYVVSGQPEFVLAPIPPAATATSSPSVPAATCSPSGSNITVVAPTGAAGSGFEQKCYAGPAGKPFTINFDNKDSGVPHNFAVYDKQGGTYLFGAKTTQIVTGPGSARYEVSAQKPGTYYFQCDVHPTSMFGTFVVK
jgi:plastocyanin